MGASKDVTKANAIKVKTKKNKADCLFHAWISEDVTKKPPTVIVTGYEEKKDADPKAPLNADLLKLVQEKAA